MAIIFSQEDGSGQHYDTYEEFEQAFILIKRLNGEKVPQDLLDEVKAKNGVKEPKTVQMETDVTELEEAFRKATEELAEELDEIAKERTPVSDECENTEKAPKFEVGDKVKVVNNLSGGHPEGTVGVIDSVSYYSDEGRHSYGVVPKSGSPCEYVLYHYEVEIESAKDYPTEFRTGDIVKVTETFEDRHGAEALVGEILEYDGDWPTPFVGCVFLEENSDKIRLMCRKEDRKDIEL